MSTSRRLAMTRQRRVILEELSKITSHPTADEVFKVVRERLPHVSLATVYRNLEVLTGAGMIQKLHVGGAQMRFDATVENHTHVRCLGCGRVDDAGAKAEVEPSAIHRAPQDYQIVGYRLELIGFCPDCRQVRQDSGGSCVSE